MEHFLPFLLSPLVLTIESRICDLFGCRCKMEAHSLMASSSLEFFRKSSRLFELFKLKMAFAAVLSVFPLWCCSVFKWKSACMLHLKYSLKRNHSRFVFDPPLVLTSPPLCYFMIRIPVEENLLIGPSRMHNPSLVDVFPPPQRKQTAKPAPRKCLLRKLAMQWQKDVFVFSDFSFTCFWGLSVEVSCIYPFEFNLSMQIACIDSIRSSSTDKHNHFRIPTQRALFLPH